jgi:type I restriction enzyme, S subunit
MRDVATINPETTKSLGDDRLIHYIDISSVDSSYQIADDLPRIALGEAPSRAKRLVREGDILVSMVRSERRSFAIVPPKYHEQVASTGFAVIRPLPGKVDPGYVWAAVRDPAFVAHLVSRQRGSNYPAVAAKDVADAPLKLPSLDQQRQIAWALGTLDRKIESNRLIADLQEQIAASVFKERFIDFTGGWSSGRVADLCELVRNGGTPRRMEPSYWEGGEISWFRTGELKGGFLPRRSETCITERGLAESACTLFPSGTVLMAIYAAPTVGRLGILDMEGTCNQACTALVAKDKVGYPYLYFALDSLRGYFNSRASGSAQQNISKAIVESAPIVLPPDEDLADFDRLARPLLARSAAALRENEVLTSIRDTLLPHLTSGRVHVSREPAQGPRAA